MCYFHEYDQGYYMKRTKGKKNKFLENNGTEEMENSIKRR